MAASISFSCSISTPLRLSIPVGRGRPRSSRVSAKIREIFMPALSSTMTEGKIVSWIKSEGDAVSKGESVVVVESDKADMDVETFYDGILAAIVVPEGHSAPVGAPIGLLAESPDEVALAKSTLADSPPAPAHATPPPPPASAPARTTAGQGKVVATPFAKKLAKHHKLDIASVVGTGPFGRITPADIQAKAGIATTTMQPPTKVHTPAALPQGSTIVPFTTMQAAVSNNMLATLSVPTFRVGYPLTTDALDALYAKVKGKGVTMTALLAKAAAMALVQHPIVNASCNNGNNFSYNSDINIAVAVSIDGGLITPVLQNAHTMDLYLLSQRWKELVNKARSKQLQPQDYNSGTFTLSNLGMFGVDRFDAILPPGQGAIMAVGASKPTVVADADGFFSVKNKMLVNVTADHRIIYGADLAAFLQTFAKIIQDPDTLTL